MFCAIHGCVQCAVECIFEDMSLQFKFPPESYSAVYESEGASVVDANVTTNGSPTEPLEPALPANNQKSPKLFSCFNCSFRNSIKVIRKEKQKNEKHVYNDNKITYPLPRVRRVLVMMRNSWRLPPCTPMVCGRQVGNVD